MPESFRTINSKEAKKIIAHFSNLFDKSTQDYYAVVFNARGQLIGFSLPDNRTLNCIEAQKVLYFSVHCLYECFQSNNNEAIEEEKLFFVPIQENKTTIGAVGFFTYNQILKEKSICLITDYLKKTELYFS